MKRVSGPSRGTQRLCRRLATLVLAGVLASACSDAGEATEQRGGGADVPAGWEAATFGEAVQIQLAAPGDWEEAASTTDDEVAAEAYGLQSEPNELGTRAAVSVSVIGMPPRDAESEVEGMQARARAVQAGEDFSAEEVDWPGAESAWSLSYRAQVMGDDDLVPHLVRIVVMDLPGGEQVHVAVSAPAEEFDALSLSEVLASVTIAS